MLREYHDIYLLYSSQKESARDSSLLGVDLHPVKYAVAPAKMACLVPGSVRKCVVPPERKLGARFHQFLHLSQRTRARARVQMQHPHRA